MICPICSSELYEKERRETTSRTLISIRCTNPGCNFFDYKILSANIKNEEIGEIEKEIKKR